MGLSSKLIRLFYCNSRCYDNLLLMVYGYLTIVSGLDLTMTFRIKGASVSVTFIFFSFSFPASLWLLAVSSGVLFLDQILGHLGTVPIRTYLVFQSVYLGRGLNHLLHFFLDTIDLLFNPSLSLLCLFEALALSLVPSKATCPNSTIPKEAHSLTTSTNTSGKASACLGTKQTDSVEIRRLHAG